MRTSVQEERRVRRLAIKEQNKNSKLSFSQAVKLVKLQAQQEVNHEQ